MTTSGTLLMILPVEPGTVSRAQKAVTVVNTEKMTGALIRCAPRIAVVSPSRSRLRSAKMFSPTTIASSTTIPSASTRAIIENMLMETPSICMPQSVPTSATDNPAATHSARRTSRKNVRARKTRTSPRRPFSTRTDRLPATSVESSLHISTPTPAGSAGITSAAR